MKTVWLIGVALFTFFCSFGQTKDSERKKDNKGNQEAAYRQGETSSDQGPGFDSPQYNNNQVGDGHTEGDQRDSDQGDDVGDQQGRIEEGISGAQNTDDTQLLGEDNRKAKGSRDSQRSSNYRNNKVSGNPNNTTISDGSNRQAGSPENPESSVAVPSGRQQQSVQGGDNPTPEGSDNGVNQTPDSENTQGTSSQGTGGTSGMTGSSNEAGTGANDTGSSSSNTQATGTPSVIQSSSTQSGSPAMKADDGTRDGTNNVQRAKPNMAGSEVSGIRSNGKSINEDTEIRKGTMQQQASPDPALAEQQQNQDGQNVGGNTTPATSNATPNNTSGTPQNQPSDSDQPAQVTDEAAKTVGEEKGQQGESSSQQTPDVKAMDTQPDLVTEKDREEKKKDRKSRKKRNRKNRD